MKILLTGGLGYIGSHTAIALCNAGYEVIIYDDLSNSKISVLSSIEKIVMKKIFFIEGNVLDTVKLTNILQDLKITSVIHFAGLKAVGESILFPALYYEVNVGGTISLLTAMRSVGVKKLIFSSSATVYGSPQFIPITEIHPLNALNPYGRTKLLVENMLNDLAVSDVEWRISCLRYFNPVGAHLSGTIGEDPLGVPNNLMPRIAQVASSLTDKLYIYGSDYPTKDGTCERDYIHVEDLAMGHLAALNNLKKQENSIDFFNLGTGESCSVLNLISIFEEITGKEVPVIMTSRRDGDAATCVADVTKSKRILSWSAKININKMCSSAWNFHRLNIKK